MSTHNHEVVFGRKVDGCLRCAELLAGAAPIAQAWRNRKPAVRKPSEVAKHDCKTSGCNSVCCTFGEW